MMKLQYFERAHIGLWNFHKSNANIGCLIMQEAQQW